MIKKSIISIISILLAIAYLQVIINSSYDITRPEFRYFLYGFFLFIPFWFLWLKKNHFYSTFEHEMTHLLVGLMFFKKPSHFTATHDSGGETGLYGNNFIITLAPYFLPTINLLLLIIYAIISEKFILPFFSVFGFFLSYHVCSTIDEFSYQQPDIYTTGKIFSTIFLIFANIVTYGFIIFFITSGFDAAIIFLKQGPLLLFQFINTAA